MYRTSLNQELFVLVSSIYLSYYKIFYELVHFFGVLEGVLSWYQVQPLSWTYLYEFSYRYFSIKVFNSLSPSPKK